MLWIMEVSFTYEAGSRSYMTAFSLFHHVSVCISLSFGFKIEGRHEPRAF
jgi:hypothetical protein